MQCGVMLLAQMYNGEMSTTTMKWKKGFTNIFSLFFSLSLRKQRRILIRYLARFLLCRDGEKKLSLEFQSKNILSMWYFSIIFSECSMCLLIILYDFFSSTSHHHHQSSSFFWGANRVWDARDGQKIKFMLCCDFNKISKLLFKI